jgi:hypothetical protein
MAAVLNCTVGHVVTSGVCFLKRFPISNRRGLMTELPFGAGFPSARWLLVNRARGRMRSCASPRLSRGCRSIGRRRGTLRQGTRLQSGLVAPASIVTGRRLVTSLNDEQQEGLAPRGQTRPEAASAWRNRLKTLRNAYALASTSTYGNLDKTSLLASLPAPAPSLTNSAA